MTFSLKSSPQPILQLYTQNYISRETAYNPQIFDQQPTTCFSCDFSEDLEFKTFFFMSFIAKREAEEVDETLNETLK